MEDATDKSITNSAVTQTITRAESELNEALGLHNISKHLTNA
jgi:hypothetical protein